MLVLILPCNQLRNLARWRLLLLCLLSSVVWDTCHYPSSGSEASIKASLCCRALVTWGPGLWIKAYVSFWLALKGRVKFAVSRMQIITPLKETKTQTMWISEATVTYCYGSHIRIEREAILGSLLGLAPASWTNLFQPSIVEEQLRPMSILLPAFSHHIPSSSLFSFRDSNQS